MSRSGYDDDYDQWSLIRWRGAVSSAIRGARGQAFLAELVAALDALPEKKLITDRLEDHGGCCALGAVARARGMDAAPLSEEVEDVIAKAFGLPVSLACEIMWLNDEAAPYDETPERRWTRVREWAVCHIKTGEKVKKLEAEGK